MAKRFILLLSLLNIFFSSSVVFAFSDSCIPYALLYQVHGDSSEDEFGTSVAALGDLNGDGVSDFIVGAPFSNPDGIFHAGSAYVYSGADGSLIYQVKGTTFLGNFGLSVSGIGDVNGDGKSDFIIGGNFRYPYNDGNGSVFVYSGLDGLLLYRRDGSSPGDLLGHSIAGVGDINHDGIPDFIAGAPSAHPGSIYAAGSVLVFSGGDGTLLYQKDGTDSAEQLGVSVAGAGDVNADGTPDFIVGATGSAVIYSGANGSLILQKQGDPSIGFGSSVAGIGDINGDGKTDFAVGAPFAGSGDQGSTFVYSGMDGSLFYHIAGLSPLSYSGNSVFSAGDVNGDGKNDFIIGTYYDGASVYSGADGSLLAPLDVGRNGGRAVASIGDINGDGKAEVIVGSPSSTFESNYRGTVLIYTIRPAAKRGDLNGDGYFTGADVVAILNTVFNGSPLTVPFCAADVQCDGVFDIVDVVYELDIVFMGIFAPLKACLP